MKFSHTNIISTDWRKLVAFYVDTFQCELLPPVRKQSGKWLERGTGLKGANLEGAHLLLPGFGSNGPTLEIYQYANIEDQDHLAPNRRGFGHIAFEVDDVQQTLNNVLSNGGSSKGEIVEREVSGVGQITFTYARDPEGNLIELQSWKRSGNPLNNG